jgi:hypothetical protein
MRAGVAYQARLALAVTEENQVLTQQFHRFRLSIPGQSIAWITGDPE